MKPWIFVVAVIVVILGIGSWFLFSGRYNIAATHPHSTFSRWLFTTVRDQSIDRQADHITAPASTDSAIISSGARHYASTCEICHGAPGQKLSEIARGMNPAPPGLHNGEIQGKYTDAELYWIVEHGIRMTGMPAFGPTHKERDLWAIVAFLKQLPDMQPEEYKAAAGEGAHHSQTERRQAG